jgi:DNA polymerase III subunit alpha, Gram-positive type
MMDFLHDKEFLELEKEYKFLSRARSAIETKHGELEKLTYVVFDLETTGLNPVNDEIIEIGGMKIENGEVKDIFNKLVRPEKPLPTHITEITGITQEMVESEPPIKPILEKFIEFIGEAILVAHNADFDTAFLKNNAKKILNKDITNSIVCTLLISRDILPGLSNHKLHTVGEYFHLKVENRHRAIGDVELTYHVWENLMTKLKDKQVLTRKDLEDYMAKLNGAKAPRAGF